MEAANITTVVTMVTSRLSRTLGKCKNQVIFCNYLKLVSSLTGVDGLDCSRCEQLPQPSPDKLGLGVDVSDAILGQALVDAVEERSQQAAHHPHQDEEGQVHCCPQVAVLISLWALMSREFHSKVKRTHYCTGMLYQADDES